MQHSLENANLEALEYLLQLKRDDNVSISQIVDQDGNTLLHKAIIYNQYDIVRYLIKNHSILINCRNKFDLYPIHLCVLKGDMPVLRLVARESKKHINKRDASDMTPAMHAAIEGKYEALKYLLDNAGAKYNKATKKEKFTLLHLGVQSGSIDIVQYLLFKMGPSYLKFRTKDGATVFHMAAARGHDQILEYLLALKSAKYLKNSKDVWGSTPAHDAAENGHCKCLKLLNDAGLNMYEEDVENMTPYELALSSKSDECKNFVLECLKPVQQLEEKENMPCWFKLSRTKRFKFKKACKSFIGNLFGLENYWKKSFFHTYRDDDTIWTKSYSVPDAFHKSFSSEQNDSQDDTLNHLDDESECSLWSNDLRNSISNNTSSQTSATNRKINLRRIGSMLRLKRAKDINHEPAYLYRQKFRPAPVSLPEQSKITSFKNEPTSQPENEDDLNDSVIDEFINHVQNNSIKQSEKTSTTIVAQCLNSTRASRYDQHKELKQNEKKEDGQSEKTNSPPKKSETSNLGIILKNSLSSSRETTPTIIRLSRSGTPTPLLQSVTQTRVVPENENADHSSKINLLNQRRVSSKEKSKSPNPVVNKQPLVKSNSDNSNFVKRHNAATSRRFSLTREEKKFEETKIRRQSLNNYTKASSTDITQIYEPEPDYWDAPYNNNINHISRTKIEPAEQSEAAVSLAQVILKSVKESIKKNDNKNYNENIIVSETVHIISDHKEIKSVESANENKCESVYNVIEDGEKLTEFKTSLKIEPLLDQSASFVSGFDDLPQPPSQSFLKMTQMELECTELELDASHLPPPPPPPPLPTSAIPTTPPALALNINTETLLMAKNNLKLKSTKAESKAKENSKLLENKDLKKNFFLLQEIQNHRLYNTKKDYVLEYLDRNTNLVPSVSYSPCSSGSTLGKMQPGNRSLSNSELNKAEDEDKVNYMPASQSPAQHSISQFQCTPVSNYERFPHLKNKNALNQNKCYPCGSYLANKRAQSSNPVNRNSLALSQPVNGRSVSVERTSKVDSDQRSFHESNNNNSCVIIIEKNEKIDTKNEQENETKESNNLVHIKKFRQIIPQEKIESELDRVFRRRALHNN